MIMMHAEVAHEDADKAEPVKRLSETVYPMIRESLSIPNFWQKPSECRALESKISDELSFSGIAEVSGKATYLTREILSLAKQRENEVRKS